MNLVCVVGISTNNLAIPNRHGLVTFKRIQVSLIDFFVVNLCRRLPVENASTYRSLSSHFST